MTSWTTLLLLHLSQGRYLSSKPPTERDWLVLWGLANEVNSPSHAETKDTSPTTANTVP